MTGLQLDTFDYMDFCSMLFLVTGWGTVARPILSISLLTIAFVLSGCGPRKPDFTVRGVGMVLNTSAPFAHSADFPGRIDSTIDAALRFWSGSWDDIDGATIFLEDNPYVACNNSTTALGCFEPGAIHITTRDPGLGTWRCVEQTVLVHEIGHAVVGDVNHDDPRWMDFVPVLEVLNGRSGYTDGGETSCPIYVNVWRHNLHSP